MFCVCGVLISQSSDTAAADIEQPRLRRKTPAAISHSDVFRRRPDSPSNSDGKKCPERPADRSGFLKCRRDVHPFRRHSFMRDERARDFCVRIFGGGETAANRAAQPPESLIGTRVGRASPSAHHSGEQQQPPPKKSPEPILRPPRGITLPGLPSPSRVLRTNSPIVVHVLFNNHPPSFGSLRDVFDLAGHLFEGLGQHESDRIEFFPV
jgi:hypothetical protein